MIRKIHPQSFPIFKDLKSSNSTFLSDQTGHIPGQAAAIRFFDPDSKTDYNTLQKILTSKPVRSWMDDSSRISFSDYKEWAGKYTPESFLFAVHDTRVIHPKKAKEIRGFVNFYSERSEKFRIKRMIKLGIIKNSPNKRHILEIGMALKPTKNKKQSGSGLMSSAIRQSCLQIRSLLNFPKFSDLIIFAFIDPINLPSVRAIEACGFVKKKKMKYDADSPEKSIVYILSWIKLHQKIKNTMLKLLENQPTTIDRVLVEPQKTDSHCGPAVTQGLLNFYQIKATQDDVVNAAKIKNKIIAYGMRPSQIAEAISVLAPNFRLWFKENTTAKDLNMLIRQHHLPVAVNWQSLFYNSIKEEKIHNPHGDHGHYSIIIDIKTDRNEITIDDPYSEYFNIPRKFSYRWFKSRWWDCVNLTDKKTKEKNTIYTKKLIFIVTPKDFVPPSSLKLLPSSKLPL